MLRSNRRLIYHPQYVRGFAVAMLRAARDLETLRQNLRFECDQLRQEVREAKGRTREAPSHRRRPSRRARPEGGAELRTTYKVAIVEKCGERCGPRAPRTGRVYHPSHVLPGHLPPFNGPAIFCVIF